MEDIDLSWGLLARTVLQGIIPNDITLQVIAWKKMDRTDDQFRLMFWDGHTLFKNAMLKSADVGPPEKWSVIRLGVDLQPESMPAPEIRDMMKENKKAYAFIFSHFILQREGSEINKRLEDPSSSGAITQPLPGTPTSSLKTTQSTNHTTTPPNVTTPSAPPQVRPRQHARSSLASPAVAAERASINRDAVKRNLAATFPEPAPPAKRLNNGSSATAAGPSGFMRNGTSAAGSSSGGNVDNRATAAASSSQGATATHPVASLNPYSNKYSIKVRVSQKGDLAEKSNSRGWQGKVINCVLSDDSGDIKLVGFNEHAETIHKSLQNGQTYLLSMAAVKPVYNKAFNTTNHEYELNWNQFTKVSGPLLADPVKINYNFVPISEIRNKANDSSIDVAGWVQDMGQLNEFTSRGDRDLKKRELVLADPSGGGSSITLILWGKTAAQFNHNNRVLAIKGAKVGEWNHVKQLSIGFSGDFEVEPDNPKVKELVDWARGLAGPSQAPSQLNKSLTGSGIELTTIQELKNELIAHKGEKKCTIFGMITSINETSVLYRACTPPDGTRCNKKVLGREGAWECAKCGRRNIQDCDTTLRFNLRLSIADCTDTHWCNMFDAASALLQMDADEVNTLMKNNPEEFEALLSSKTLRPLVFRVDAKIQTYNDAPRLQMTVNEVKQINWEAPGGGADRSASSSVVWQDLARPLIAEVHAIEAEMGLAHDIELGITWPDSVDV